MSASDSKKQLPEQITKSMKDLDLKEIDWHRPPSQSDFDYLLDHCPFLQIIDTSYEPAIEPEVKIITAESGWNVHYYGDAMSSSPGLLLYGGGDFRIRFFEELQDQGQDDDEGGDGSIINSGKGTFRYQAFLTAKEMILIAKKMGWEGVQIIDGHPLMKWSAWVAASDLSLFVSGYQPTDADEQKRKRVKRSRAELEMIVGYVSRRGR